MDKDTLNPIIRGSLGKDALNCFLKTFNEHFRVSKNEAASYLAAYTALKKEGFKKQDGKWVKPRVNYLAKMNKVTKKDTAKQQVFGFFSIVEEDGKPVIDLQNDVITSDDLEKAAYNYVKYSRMGDDSHDNRHKALLIESIVLTKEKQKALGIDLGYVGWWGGFEVMDKELWEKIASDHYKSFSIGGVGTYEQYKG